MTDREQVADAEVPMEFLLRVERDRARHELAEARKEIARLQMLLRYAEAAMYEEYRLRMAARLARPSKEDTPHD